MTRRKKTSESSFRSEISNARQMKRRKPIGLNFMKKIEPLTDNQKKLFEAYSKGQNIIAYGSAGTGKSFIVLYNALREVLDEITPYDKIYLVRSAVAVRELGFLPGLLEDKIGNFELPYINMVKYMFSMSSDADLEMLYKNLKNQGTIDFCSTSFIRGRTIDNSIIIVDEFSNLNGHELDSIITRVGENTKIMFCGDATQSDLVKMSDRNGIHSFMKILKNMPSFDIIEFGPEDVCRSGLVKEYLLTKYELDITL